MRRSLISVLMVMLLALPAIAADHGQLRNDRPIRVMTQNLYVGADVFRIQEATSPDQIPFVAAEIYETFLGTDFDSRAARLAVAIQEERPDLIGLQEVALLTRLAPSDPPTVAVYDFLEMLLAAMDDLELDYEVAGIAWNADVELPVLTEAGLGLIRYMDRDVILARKNVGIADVVAGHYTTYLQVPLGNPPYGSIDFIRGYVTLQATLGKRSFRFATTHLENRGEDISPMFPMIQAAQAQELIALFAVETIPVVVTGDFNSDPFHATTPAIVPPYAQFVGSGFADVWIERSGPFELGLTCCQEEELTNPVSFLDERVDHIFVRNTAGLPNVSRVKVETVCDELEDRTPAGLWPSDHAGVTARIQMPQPNSRAQAGFEIRQHQPQRTSPVRVQLPWPGPVSYAEFGIRQHQPQRTTAVPKK